MDDPVWLRWKDLAEYTKQRYGYILNVRTIQRWKVKHPFSLPVRTEEFRVWFEARIEEKARRS